MKDEKKTKIYNVLIAILTFTIIALTIVFEFNVPAEVTFAIIIIGSVLLVALVIILVLEIRLEKKMKREKTIEITTKKRKENKAYLIKNRPYFLFKNMLFFVKYYRNNRYFVIIYNNI